MSHDPTDMDFMSETIIPVPVQQNLHYAPPNSPAPIPVRIRQMLPVSMAPKDCKHRHKPLVLEQGCVMM